MEEIEGSKLEKGLRVRSNLEVLHIVYFINYNGVIGYEFLSERGTIKSTILIGTVRFAWSNSKKMAGFVAKEFIRKIDPSFNQVSVTVFIRLSFLWLFSVSKPGKIHERMKIWQDRRDTDRIAGEGQAHTIKRISEALLGLQIALAITLMGTTYILINK